MLVLIGKRIGIMVLTMFAVSVLLFLLLELSPGNVATKVLGQFASEEQKNLWLEKNGYFEPLWYRYATWAGNFITGDLGESHRYRIPVGEIMWPRLWNTAILAFWTFALLIPVSLVLGVLAGMREGSKLDRSISVTRPAKVSALGTA